jgi:N-acetylneuraminic acid mutarotase
MKSFCCVRENLWKPPARFGASFTNCQGRAYMFGGFNSQSLNDIIYIDSAKGKWVQVLNIKGKRPPERYGHTTTYHKGSLIIFGGE